MKTLFRLTRILSIAGLAAETVFFALVTLSKTLLKEFLAELSGGYEFPLYTFISDKLGANWAVGLFALISAVWLLYTLIFCVKSGKSASGKDVGFFVFVFFFNLLIIALTLYFLLVGVDAVPYLVAAIAVSTLQVLCCLAPGRYFRRIRR